MSKASTVKEKTTKTRTKKTNQEIVAKVSGKQQVELKTKAPEMSVLEFHDIAKRFSKRGAEHAALMKAIIEDPDVMTRDTGRINKTKLCKATGIKSKRIDDLILELRDAMKQ